MPPTARPGAPPRTPHLRRGRSAAASPLPGTQLISQRGASASSVGHTWHASAARLRLRNRGEFYVGPRSPGAATTPGGLCHVRGPSPGLRSEPSAFPGGASSREGEGLLPESGQQLQVGVWRLLRGQVAGFLSDATSQQPGFRGNVPAARPAPPPTAGKSELGESPSGRNLATHLGPCWTGGPPQGVPEGDREVQAGRALSAVPVEPPPRTRSVPHPRQVARPSAMLLRTLPGRSAWCRRGPR